MLERAFDACTTRDARALEQIDRLLGVQHSREGQADGLPARFAIVWNRAARVFPERLIQACPDWECSAGFSNQFIVWSDPLSSTVIVDPAWWLTTYEFESDQSNPFKSRGYYHAMSYYGTVPGSMYGALQREGEACSRWSEIAGKHYTDSTLTAIDCGGGWYCMCYCK